MQFHETPLLGVTLIELNVMHDERGWFARSFCRDTFQLQGLETEIMQVNQSYCKTRGILRGLHYQRAPKAETKLVRCVKGAIFDVAVDLRRNSPTFLQWYGVNLDEEAPYALCVGPGFAHGYQALSDHAAVVYQSSASYAPHLEGCVKFDDPRIAIEWPLLPPILSSKDRSIPWLEIDFLGIEV
jgi:dTDP-4-dehydrorhamnose 3,5-epimerase